MSGFKYEQYIVDPFFKFTAILRLQLLIITGSWPDFSFFLLKT